MAGVRFGRGKAFNKEATGGGAFCRTCRVGTPLATKGCGWANKRSSTDKKKKVRLWPSYKRGTLMGPPNVPPKLLKRSGGLGSACWLANQLLASVLSFRKYSKREPE